MKQIRISTEYFDLEAFLARTVEFLRELTSPEVAPSYGIVWVQSSGDVPVFGPESGWDVLAGLKEEGKMVFFPFAFKDVDGTFATADDNTYRPTSREEDTEHGMLIGLEDSIGFLVQIKEGSVYINSAVHTSGGCPGPLPGVDLRSDCGVLEEPMERLIRSFIKS